MAQSQIESVVIGVVTELAKRKGHAGSLSLEHALVKDLGLGSLDLAEAVALLEVETGWDPFSQDASIASMRTVGDLCKAYTR